MPTVVPAKVFPTAVVPPVVVAKVTPPPKPIPEQWMLNTSDVTLRRALGKWAAKAGWQLVWDASVDVPINVTATFEGDFRSAVKRLFQSLSAADVNLTGMLYAGNKVLRVTESGRRAQ
ncbi:toxin co-regulated pilus biosynthesis Q family protein [Pseudomonas sp. AK106]